MLWVALLCGFFYASVGVASIVLYFAFGVKNAIFVGVDFLTIGPGILISLRQRPFVPKSVYKIVPSSRLAPTKTSVFSFDAIEYGKVRYHFFGQKDRRVYRYALLLYSLLAVFTLVVSLVSWEYNLLYSLILIVFVLAFCLFYDLFFLGPNGYLYFRQSHRKKIRMVSDAISFCEDGFFLNGYCDNAYISTTQSVNFYPYSLFDKAYFDDANYYFLSEKASFLLAISKESMKSDAALKAIFEKAEKKKIDFLKEKH